MVRRARRSGESLAQCYRSTPVLTGAVPHVDPRRIKETVVARSPIHFERGDMRRAYGWTSAILTAMVAVGALAIVLRALLTGLFVAFVTSDVLLVVGFNVCVTVVVGRWFVEKARIHPLERRRRGF